MSILGAGIVMILVAIVFYLARKETGRFQAHVLLAAFGVGKHRQHELAQGLASAWTALAVLIATSGLIIILTSLLTR